MFKKNYVSLLFFLFVFSSGFAQTVYTFTNAGASGRLGPTLSQITSAYQNTNLAGRVTMTTRGIQEWTVPSTGYYIIKAFGAQGAPAEVGGKGVILESEFFLVGGQKLLVLVGQTAGIKSGRLYRSSAGGGGTFVVKYNPSTYTLDDILLIAGGGGGSGSTVPNLTNGQTTTSGGSATFGGSGGTNGNGGNIGNATANGAGGGFFTNGTASTSASGFSFLNGGNGGATNDEFAPEGGGFGGGGAPNNGDLNRFAGGGGYSGGGASNTLGSSPQSGVGGGGGGSFVNTSATNVKTSNGLYNGTSSINSSSITNLASYNSGHGRVEITQRTGSLTIVTSGGSALNDGWIYSNGVIVPYQDVTINASVIESYLASGNLTLDAAQINLNESITSTVAGRSLTLKSMGDIVVATSKTITTNGGDVVLWSNSDGEALNGGVFFDQSASVITNGGHIWIGGGSGTTSWNGLNVGNGYAVSGRNLINFLTRSTYKIDWETGVLLNETILNTAGGNIYIAGQRNTRINSDVGAGVVNYNGTNGTTINSGNGTIEIKGDGALAANVTLGFLTGLHPGETTGQLRIQSSNVSQSNAISIQATNATTDFAGLLVEDDTYILSTAVSGGGAISIVGTSAGNNFGIWTQVGSLNVLSASGPIVVDAGIKGIGLHVNSTLVNTSGQSISNAGHLYLGSRVGSMLTSSTAPIQLLSDRFVTNTGTTINLATTGIVNALSKSAIFSEAVNTAQWNLASNLGGLIIGRSTNSSNITLGSVTTIAGPVTVYGGNISVNGNMNTSAGNATGDIVLKASGDIVVAATRSVTTNGGDVVFWSDADANSSGAITIGDNSTINTANGSTDNGLTGGGHIVLGGGADDGSNGEVASDGIPDGFAFNATGNGIRLGTTTANHTQMFSGGGNLIVRGRSTQTGSNITNIGLFQWGRLTANSGKGAITMNGTSAGFYGINFVEPASNISTGDKHLVLISDKSSGDAITITGISSNNYGVVFNYNNPKEILATGGGNVAITGAAGSNFGVFLQNQDVLASSGTISINGGTLGIRTLFNGARLGSKTGSQITSSSANIVLTGNAFTFDTPTGGFATSILTTGTLTLQPSGTSFSSAFTWPNTNVTLSSGISGLTIGKATNTSNITIGSPTTVLGPVSLFGGALDINSALTATNNTINLNASSSVTQSAALTANNLSLNGTGSFTLNNASNNITTLAGGSNASKLGSLSFTDAIGGLTIGTVGANSGLTATGTILVESLIGDVTLAQNIKTDNTTSNAVVVNAGKSSAIGTITGGNILISGTPTITMGSGGIAKLYSGSEAASTGLTTLVGGLGNTRFSADEGTTTFSPVLAAGNSYAIYRSTLPASPTNVVATAGNTQISIAFTEGADGGGSITNYEYTINGGTTWIAASLAITSSPLVITGLTNYTAYTVQIRAVNNAGAGTASASVSATPFAPATAPSDITLSASAVNENVAANTVIGAFSSTDVNLSDTFTYTLAAGSGDTDNGAFNISGANLRITASPDFETKSSYNVRVRTTDQGGLFFEKAFTITVTDVFDTPTITVSSNTLNTFTKCVGSASLPQSFTVSGVNMSAGISVNALAGFEYSLASNGTYSTTLTVGAVGTITPTDVFVRMQSTANNATYASANIALSSTSATTLNVIASGTVITIPAPTFSAPTVQSFTSLGATTWTAPIGVASVEYLVVGGGGGGGNGWDSVAGGGGGAGMVLTGRLAVTPGAAYPITIGDGGIGGSNVRGTNNGTVGENTEFASIRAFGGGRGFSARSSTINTRLTQNSNFDSAFGGSGGTGGGSSSTGGSGGGGAVGNGNANSGATAGTGGSGRSSSITGSSLIYGAGGNGGTGNTLSTGANGLTNRGNGGNGGSAGNASSAAGGKGGSGIVVLRYATQAASITYCQGETALPLQATAASGNTLQWYTESTGGAASTTAPTPDTSTPGITFYYVSQIDNTTGCESPRATITVTVNAIPVAPTMAATTINYCMGDTATALTASVLSGHSIYWFEGNNQLSSASPVPLTTSVGTTTYSVSQRNMPTGCDSPRISMNVNVIDTPATPVANTTINLCRGTTATELTASSTTGNTLQWYIAASGGTASTTAPTPSTASNGTTTYYVSQKNDLTGCESARIAITVIVASTAPIINTQPLASLERCQSLMFHPYNTIAADVAGGSTIQWYSNATNSSTGGTPVVNANNVSSYGNIISTLTFNNSPGTTYYYLVATGINGCSTTSSISAVTVSPIAVAGSIGTTTPSICFGESATLTLSGHTGSVQWQQKVNSSTYNPIDGATSATFVTPPFTNTNTYRALVSSPSCNTLATNEVSVTVAPARLLNQGLGFDGVDDKVTISNSPRLPVGGTSGFTLEAWVYVDPTMTNQSGGIVSKIVWQSSPTADGSGLGYGLDIENGKARLILGRGVGTRAEAISGSTIPTGTWVHLAGTYNNSIARLYVNGVQDGYAVVSDAFWNNDSAPLTIGSWPLESKYFKGKIDEVRIWNTVRSAIQILHNKDKELIGNEAGLVANYDFNQGIPNGANAAITTILDKSSNALNGTLQNFSLSGTSSNWIASGAMILSETTINTNQAVTLTHTHSGGSWSSSNSSVLSVNTSTGEATPIADGTATISYVFTLNGCTYTSTKLFTVVIPTAITSFTPISGAIGSTVVITGTGFTNATSVQFSGTNATSFTVNSATQITATVPSGATTGSIVVTAVGGTGTSSSNFIIIQALAPPSISFASATQTAVVNRAISIATINLGGAATFTIAPALPTGVALNSSTGLISGTPTAIMASRSYTVTATNAAGSSSATFTFFIDSDLDGDGIGDATDPDIDGDGVPNSVELQEGTSPTNPNDKKDTDGDGVPDYVELQQGTNPSNPNAARDTDGDGVPDYVELQQGTNPNNPNDARDTDSDGVPDYIENQQGTDPSIPKDVKDTDGDGIPDYIELQQGTNPNTPGDQLIDSDGDGVPNYIETLQGTNPNTSGDQLIDSDGDGVPDYVEIQQGTNPTNPNDARDSDGDGVPNYIEIQQGTNPSNPNDAKDTDGDGIPDYIETQQGTNPTVPGDQLIDSDNDGIPNYIEELQGTNPNTPGDQLIDSDGDGVPNYAEVQQGTNPTNPNDAKDTDGDGVPDYVEIQQGTIPSNPNDKKDTDGDGVPDYVELQQGTNPTNPNDARDTDSDGVPDYVEVQQGTIPTNPGDYKDSDGDGVPDYIEVQQGTNPSNPVDVKDTDGDGIADYIEVQQGTNPNAPGDSLLDTDGDGVPDYIEILQGTNPNAPGDQLIDTDGDGVPNYVEVQQGTDPTNAGDFKDNDGDGVPDFIEVQQGTNPANPNDVKDTDGDGIADFIEEQQGTNPTVPGDQLIDLDGDGVPNYVEIQQGTNPNAPGDQLIDSDGDGVPNYVEIQQGTNPNNPNDARDSDGDGVPNYIEIQQGTNPSNPNDAKDTDGDGIPDYIETQQGTNPTVPGDQLIDTDNDGIPNYIEELQGTNPNTPGDRLIDSDGDGVPNYAEVQQGTNPNNPNDARDSDGDGVPDYIEVQQGTNPSNPNDVRDSDGDGIPDYIEVQQGTNPAVPGDQLIDSDGDGVPNYIEELQGTNPNVPGDELIDSDDDGVPDYAEVQQGTQPSSPGDALDTDGDGVPDYIEIQQGSNPSNPSDSIDTDVDGIPDYIEEQQGTNPNIPGDAKDNDGDGVPDYIEFLQGTNPNAPGDQLIDTDGDGVPDYIEIRQGTNPNVPNIQVVDTDGDGILDAIDTDDDGDTIPDLYDAFPLDKNEWKDTDGDGIGDNADTDDDNDGILDVCDVDINGDGIPDNATDRDGDGIIDSCDQDRDGDGVNNTSDNCPDTPNRDQADRDRDGLGNVCDTIELNVMEGLTPNGDGINDTWVIYNIENHPGSIVRVYNTNGKQVFYSANYKNDWNGNYQGSSEMLPVGSYMFQIDLDGDGTIDSQGWMYISK